MKAKLKKERDGDYTLTLNNPKEYPHSLPLLSKQNCDEIFGVVDVEKLFNEVDETIDFDEFCFSSFKLGFNKAIELNQHKLNWFKEPEMFEVEIEMVQSKSYKDKMGNVRTQKEFPKLDENGCLILKMVD
jgi:hypothetical protein